MKAKLKYQANLVTQLTIALGSLSSISPAQAIQFNFTYAENSPQEIIDGFNKAGNIWSSKLQDKYFDINCLCNRDTTVNLYINFQELSNPKALGGTRPTMVKVGYDDFLTNTFQNITDNNDLLAMKNLQINNNYKNIFANRDLQEIQNLSRKYLKFMGSEFSMVMNNSRAVNFDNYQRLTSSGNTILDNNGNANNKTIWLSSANAKALNLIAGNESGFDAQISLGNSMRASNGEIISYSGWLAQQSGFGNFVQDSIWDFSSVYSHNATIASKKFDFLSVAQHEIGHALGIISGSDAVEVLMNSVTKGNSPPLNDEDLTFVTPIDLFRYSENSNNQGVFDWSKGSGKYFSIDGGQTRLGNFDGANYQTSHWSASEGEALGIMHPVLKKGEKLEISDIDLKLLDVIGWEINSQSQDMIEVDVNIKQPKRALNASIIDNYISRGSKNYTATGTNYLEALDINYLSPSEYEANKTQYTIDDIIQNADFNQDFITHNHEDHEEDSHDIVSVPEPRTTCGLGIIGLMGLGWLFKRH
ncbi:NF038122 family metalloprotease [Calothrix sp. NIES-2100]|uniref:NF038122 family metalloprotease n=1 Tax=Calothrix sp. NIES-2100 TaxID=1954172 RepID=UPI0030DAFB99